jgi:hypothetical protein
MKNDYPGTFLNASFYAMGSNSNYPAPVVMWLKKRKKGSTGHCL